MTQQKQLLRGRTLSFHAEPQDSENRDSFSYIEDGALLVENGQILASGSFDTVKQQAPEAHIIDHRPHLLMAGFIDTHLHFPQMHVIASWGAQLLDWLNNYTFPEEARFSDEPHCRRMAGEFFDQLTAHGTTTAVAYCSVHRASAEAYFDEAQRRNMCMIGGKVMMDRNARDDLHDTPQTSYDDTKALIEKWHGKGRAHYAISPRFAITSSPEQMEMASALVNEHSDCFVQTHLSENLAEIAFAAELYPKSRDYLDIYQSYGLLGDKMFLGHCIHLKPREIDAIAETGSHPVFCPTSNLFLGSGLFDDGGLRQKGISNAIATDIGGGTSYSMLSTLAEGYKVLQLQGQQMHPLRAFHWVTLGNATTLGLQDRIGSLAVGSDADIVVLDAGATRPMSIRMEQATTLSEELFVLQMLGDDRSIVQTYIAGEPQK